MIVRSFDGFSALRKPAVPPIAWSGFEASRLISSTVSLTRSKTKTSLLPALSLMLATRFSAGLVKSR